MSDWQTAQIATPNGTYSDAERPSLEARQHGIALPKQALEGLKRAVWPGHGVAPGGHDSHFHCTGKPSARINECRTRGCNCTRHNGAKALPPADGCADSILTRLFVNEIQQRHTRHNAPPHWSKCGHHSMLWQIILQKGPHIAPKISIFAVVTPQACLADRSRQRDDKAHTCMTTNDSRQ